MNRPLKFRVWDVEQNKFLPSYADKGIEFYHEQGKDWHEKQVRDIVPVSWFLQDHNNNLANYIVTQYTGLKDKNDKEICEGDILEWKGEFIAEVFFEQENAAFVSKSKTDGKAFMSENYVLNFQIIGNIFEHSELLN